MSQTCWVGGKFHGMTLQSSCLAHFTCPATLRDQHVCEMLWIGLQILFTFLHCHMGTVVWLTKYWLCSTFTQIVADSLWSCPWGSWGIPVPSSPLPCEHAPTAAIQPVYHAECCPLGRCKRTHNPFLFIHFKLWINHQCKYAGCSAWQRTSAASGDLFDFFLCIICRNCSSTKWNSIEIQQSSQNKLNNSWHCHLKQSA